MKLVKTTMSKLREACDNYVVDLMPCDACGGTGGVLNQETQEVEVCEQCQGEGNIGPY